MMHYRKKNPDGGGLHPREKATVDKLTKTYVDYHWGAKPTKIIRVKDPLVPDVVAMGRLEQFEVEGIGTIDFSPGGWLAWDPKHKLTPLYVILAPADREKFRNLMKHVKKTVTLQSIAKQAGGIQAKRKLPNVKAVSLGPIVSVVYATEKVGDGWSSYCHDYGGDGMGGHLPYAAIDVSGRWHIVAGSYIVKEAGVVG